MFSISEMNIRISVSLPHSFIDSSGLYFVRHGKVVIGLCDRFRLGLGLGLGLAQKSS